jgi:hypothetical protein
MSVIELRLKIVDKEYDRLVETLEVSNFSFAIEPLLQKTNVMCSLRPDEIISLVDGLRMGRIAGADIAEHIYEQNARLDKVISELEDAFGRNDT